MNDLTVNASITIDPSTPFSAYRYYIGLREAGCDPVIRDGALQYGLNETSALDNWAATHDPKGAQRLEYARAIWATRAPGAKVVDLGIRQ